MADKERIIHVNIEEEMKSAYIDYSMSVIVSRAIPDVRDGLKPVHRRVLYGMNDLGLYYNRPHKKSARIVGEVLGKYHPHGDSSVYDSMVRMAQTWSLRYPLVDGQGNFGSVDGDPPAAMRYTEARLSKISDEILKDIDKNTVDFQLNFDDTLQEPTVLPARIPNLLINGSSGIAVGMATNILPHNITEVIDGTIAYIDNNDITIPELMKYVKAPDFPTGGIIYGYEGVKEGFETGRGRVIVRAKADIEFADGNARDKIIVTELPYQVNKAVLQEKAAALVNDKKIEGIAEIRDESDRKGMRLVFELKRDANANVVLNHLYKYTYLQTSFGVNNIALANGRPKLFNLKELIAHFVDFRHEVVVRRTEFELDKAKQRAHILEGLIIAVDNLDEVIKLIRGSSTPDEAKEKLMSTFELSEIQAKAILDMRLQKLTGLEIDKLRAEYDDLMKDIAHMEEILANSELRFQIIKDELLEVKEKYGDERRTEIDYAGGEMNMIDFIDKEDVVLTISRLGYIKRTPLEEYKVQNRGGKGSKGGATRDEDFIEHIMIANTHNTILFFTEMGKCYWLNVYEIPEGTKTSKGRPVQNILSIPKEDNIRAFIKVEDLEDEDFYNSHYVMFCTKKGVVKKTLLEQFSRPRSNGINAITIKEGDQLLEAKLTNGINEIVIASNMGKAIRFPESEIRSMGRSAAGVRGIRMSKKGEVIGMVTVDSTDIGRTMLVVSENGYGKRTYLDDPEDGEPIYRITRRGGKGVKTLNITDKTGMLIALKDVTDENDLVIINKSGLTIRMDVSKISTLGRATQGVRLIKLNKDDSIAAVAKVEKSENDDEEE